MLFKIQCRADRDSFEVWQRTYEYRKKFFETAEPLENIFDTLPILMQSFGFELILDDFKTKNEMIFDQLFTKWESFKLKCLPLLQLKVKELKGKLFLKVIAGKSEDAQNLLLWLLHSVLVPTSRRKQADGTKYIK
ncbi:uncharacterized protein LOC122817747 [Drosophila biarmipes]|uniref:uncharacterized protein LOC122817747 n=1 Tax=Drosophila biarmipes TaxID=125945 RepID=UPI0007E81815|nr:uncharacterized protein LOC122817747 [Drosophila biarmipes]